MLDSSNLPSNLHSTKIIARISPSELPTDFLSPNWHLRYYRAGQLLRDQFRKSILSVRFQRDLRAMNERSAVLACSQLTNHNFYPNQS